VDLYYGGEPASPESPVQWDGPRRTVRTPNYEVEFDPDGGIRSLRFPLLDHDLLSGASGAALAPLVRQAHPPHESLPLPAPRLRVETDPDQVGLSRLAVTFDQDTPQLTLQRRFLFAPSFFLLDFHLQVRSPVRFFSPLAVPHCGEMGTLVPPDGTRIATRGGSGQVLFQDVPSAFPGFLLSSETGYFLWAETGETPLSTSFEYAYSSAASGVAALGFRSPTPGDRIAGRFRFLPATFMGDFTFDRAQVLRSLFLAPNFQPPKVGEEESAPLVAQAARDPKDDSRLCLEAGDLRFVLQSPPDLGGHARFALETTAGLPILSTANPYILEIPAGKRSAGGPTHVEAGPRLLRAEGDLRDPLGARWHIRSCIIPRLLEGRILFEEKRHYTLRHPRTVEARFRIDVDTPCAPPLWEKGEATVFMPGQMARGNYCPGQPHGGGPKWGPSEIPELCELCKPGVLEGHADHWTLAASRLPNTWAAAADRTAGVLAFLGTTPRTALGEASVGFHSPAEASTRLCLATPITYEPWVPLGYARFVRRPRRDTFAVAPGRTICWRVFFSGVATRNLNDWFDLDKAMYGLAAPWRPDAYKMTHEEALRCTLSSLYKHFYNPETHTIAYGSGSDACHAPIGFTGMAHSALCLLTGGTRLEVAEWRQAGLDVIDEIARAFLQGPDFPFAAWLPETGWTTGTAEPGYAILCALDNLLEAIDCERAGENDHPEWERAARRCCDAWVAAQSPRGAFPLKHPGMGPHEFPVADYEATNITVGVIACLIDAARLFDHDRYLDAARRAADFYGALLDEGKLWGGPGDIEALVNSEVPMFYLRAFVRLALRTGDPRHVAWARDAAAWRLAFQFAHCWPLDPGSQLFRQGWAGLGSETASASNLHSVCFGAINVPDYALAYRLFGDPHWIERLRDLADYATQQFGRFPGDVGVLDEGQGTESWWTTDTAWGKGNVLLYQDKPNLGFMAWTTGWSAYGLVHALRLLDADLTAGDPQVPALSRTPVPGTPQPVPGDG